MNPHTNPIDLECMVVLIAAIPGENLPGGPFMVKPRVLPAYYKPGNVFEPFV